MPDTASPESGSIRGAEARVLPPPFRADWTVRTAKAVLHYCGAIGVVRATESAATCVRILSYHAVTDDLSYCGPDVAVSPAQFAGHLAHVARFYRVISLDHVLGCLERDEPFPKRAVCITFDDGYLDNYRHAFPLLRRYGLTATFFVTADPVVNGGRFWVGWLHRAVLRSNDPAPLAESFGVAPPGDGVWTYGARRRLVDAVSGVVNRGDLAGRDAVMRRVEACLEPEACADDAPFMMGGGHLREMRSTGMTIGSHSLTHPILASLPDEQARVELERSRTLLETAIDAPVEHVAYPNGPGVDRNFTSGTAQLAAAAGYRSACSSVRGMTDRRTDRYALVRQGINQRIDISGFAFKLEEHRLPGFGRDRGGASYRAAPRPEGGVTKPEARAATSHKGRRVLIIVENLPVPFDRRVWQEAQALTADGFRVMVICPTGQGCESRHEVIDGVEIFRHPLPLEARGAVGYLLEYGAALLWETWLTFRIFVTRGFDVIHACNPPDLIFLVALPYKLLFRKTFVFDHHDLCPELARAKFGEGTKIYRLMLWLERASFRLADKSIATNESYRRVAIERGRMPPEDIAVVRSGPDLGRIRPVSAEDRWRGDARHVVGYVGVMGKQEGIPYLLEAARLIVYQHCRNDVRFVLVGSGPEFASLRAEADAKQLNGHVQFTGRIADDELISALSSCDICVNPDEFNPMNDQSTMNKVLEYMALGKPIVQFELTEGRISAGDASAYARPNDAGDMAAKILELLDDPDRRARMGQLGRERVENGLGWPHQRCELLRFYRGLTRRHRSVMAAQ